MVINRFEVWLVNLDPTTGSEIKKIRPCLILSPNEANMLFGNGYCFTNDYHSEKVPDAG